MTIATALYPSAKDIYVLLEPTNEPIDFYSIRLTRSGRIVRSKVMNMFSLPQYEIRYTCIMTWFFVHTSIKSNNVKNIFAHLRLFTLIFIRPSRDGPYYVIGYGGRPHRFPHNNFSSVYWFFTKLGHMIPLWKGKNPIYFGVITNIPFDNLYRREYFVTHTFLVLFWSYSLFTLAESGSISVLWTYSAIL